MAFPPERITVKRRRDEDPVDALYFPPPKSRRTFVWNRVSVPPFSSDQAVLSAADLPQVPTVRTTLPKEDHSRRPSAGHVSSPQNAGAEPSRNVSSSSHRVTGLFQLPKPQGQPSLQVRQEPRKFHFTRTTTPVRIPSVLYSGIQKSRKKHEKTLAVFMERTKDLDWSQGRMTDSLDSEGKRNRLDNITARLVAQPSSPSKRPLASPAERMWRDKTWKQSPGNKARKSPAATRAQETDSVAHSLHLASRLQQFALDVSRTESEALALHEKACAQFKPGSPKPRPWMGRTEAANETRHDPEHAMDSSVVQKKDLDNFVFDVYVRQVEEKSGEASNEPFNAALEATNPEKVGLLVVTDEDEETWELYGNEDQSSGDEWDSEEDDENAEGYYGNDYPEDELDSDDEYDNDAYKHWHGAFDNEDFEGNTNWSDDEYASKSARSST